MNHLRSRTLDINYNSMLSDSLDRMSNVISKKNDDDFMQKFEKAQDDLDELINDNPFFTNFLPGDKRPSRRHNFSLFQRRKQKKHPHPIKLKPIESEYKNQFLDIPSTQPTINKVQSKEVQSEKKKVKRGSILSIVDKDFISQIAKVNNSSEEKEEEKEKEKVPLILKIKDKNLKTLIIENKSAKNNNKRKGAMISNQAQVQAFLKAIQQKTEKPSKDNEKEFESNEIINKVLKQNSTLHNIYSKCINQIRNGEEIDKYIDYIKRKEQLQIAAQNKTYNSRLQQLEDQMVLAGIEKPKKNLIHILIGNQPIYLESNIRDKKTSFQNQVERIDVIPKISEHLAYSNRNAYMSKFNYDYSDDQDFLFQKEYCKIKGIDMNGNDDNAIDGFGNHKKKIKKKNSSDLGNEIEFILDMTEKEKNMLIRRIKDDKEKYLKNGYFNDKNKAMSSNSSEINLMSEPSKVFEKSARHVLMNNRSMSTEKLLKKKSMKIETPKIFFSQKSNRESKSFLTSINMLRK